MTSDEQVMGLQLFLNKTENHPRPKRPKTKKVWTNITNLQSPRKPEKDAFVATKHQHYHTLSAVRLQDLRAEDASRQTSDEWLNNHGLVALHLTTRDLVAMGNIQSNDETINADRIRRGDGGSVQHELRRKPPESLEYDLDAVTDFECKLHAAITDYTLRIKWLLQSSRRVFGMIKGENVGLLLDASNTNMGYGRDQSYRNNLIKLIDEQLSAPHMKTLFVATYGTRTSILWPVPMTVNGRVLDELKTFIQKEMQPSGSSNLLDGIKTLLRQGRRMLDCIVIVCGSCPDQAGPHIISYTEQLLAGYETPRLHLVDYDSRNLTVSRFLAQLANIHGTNSFHCYSTGNEATIYTSDDIAKILKEISIAQVMFEIYIQMNKNVLTCQKLN
ncbi:hypothetical protein FGIG_11605 [Fasciola gigantica]|uniref:VWFA domain-containing protein n=1 Tax=Fasciola gigantica TaxID=46835 RepID=A0A504YZV2_FASGI|nr:hypothetical protein FGIG_11605 [Fasciola gigantica]